MYDDEKGNKTYCRIRVYTYIYTFHRHVSSMCTRKLLHYAKISLNYNPR